MTKGKSWLAVLVAGVVGYVLGLESNDTSTNAVAPAVVESTGVTLAPKSQRIQPILPKKSPVTSLLKKQQPRPTQRQTNTFDPLFMYVDANRLNVRDSPSLQGKQIWTLKRDERVTVIGRNQEWLLVSSERFKGWVFGTYLTKKPTQKPRVTVAAPTGLTDSAIKKILIKRSHAYYSGSCPCPYNRTRSGSRCGGRSAYSRPGGASPLCYESDVSQAMVAEYRARQ